jgi:hypothetical protein
MITADGSQVLIRSIPLAPAGTSIGALVLVRDMTEANRPSPNSSDRLIAPLGLISSALPSWRWTVRGEPEKRPSSGWCSRNWIR